MFAQAFEDLLQGHCTTAIVRDIDAGASGDALWRAIDDAGFLALTLPEEQGGAGLSRADLFPILLLLGRYAAPLPLASTLLAPALLGAKSHHLAGPVGLAGSLRQGADGGWVCDRLTHGMQLAQVLSQHQGEWLLLDAAKAQRQASGVAGSHQASLSWSASAFDAAVMGRVKAAEPGLRHHGAALHAVLLAGALQRVFDMTLQYANDRVQFGKPIGKFQVIQQQIAVMAEEVAAARVAAELAWAGEALTARQAAVAKARCSEAVVQVAAIAHAVHGAIGVTVEFDLQLYTRKLHEWRLADGSEAHWQAELGRELLGRRDFSVADQARELSPLG